VTATPSRVVELAHSAACPAVGLPELDKFPLPEGVAHVPSPLQKVEAEADVPLFKFVTGRLPVTPVDNGRPVQLVKTPDVGVPRIGVTSVGLVAFT
jgi:hypothetical protein